MIERNLIWTFDIHAGVEGDDGLGRGTGLRDHCGGTSLSPMGDQLHLGIALFSNEALRCQLSGLWTRKPVVSRPEEDISVAAFCACWLTTC